MFVGIFQPLFKGSLAPILIELNNLNNVTIVDAAVSDNCWMMHFATGVTNSNFHMSESGGVEVNTIKLDDIINKNEIPTPDFLKIDVEGAELLVLHGSKQSLAEFHPTIFLATHGSKMHKECSEFLQSLGYTLTPIGENDIKSADEAFNRSLIAQYDCNY